MPKCLRKANNKPRLNMGLSLSTGRSRSTAINPSMDHSRSMASRSSNMVPRLNMGLSRTVHNPSMDHSRMVNRCTLRVR